MTAAQREAMGRWTETKKRGASVAYDGARDKFARLQRDKETLADLSVSLFDETPIDIGDVVRSLGLVESHSYGDSIAVSVGTVMLTTRGQLAMLLEVLKGGGR